jgi:hypothetical protein
MAIGTTRLLPWNQAVESISHLASCVQSCKSNFLTALNPVTNPSQRPRQRQKDRGVTSCSNDFLSHEVQAIAKFVVAERLSYLSTGGGVEFLKGETLPAIAILNERTKADPDYVHPSEGY